MISKKYEAIMMRKKHINLYGKLLCLYGKKNMLMYFFIHTYFWDDKTKKDIIYDVIFNILSDKNRNI